MTPREERRLIRRTYGLDPIGGYPIGVAIVLAVLLAVSTCS